MPVTSAREEILAKVRAAVGRSADRPVPAVPASARMAPREGGDDQSEMELLLGEIAKVGGVTRRLHSARSIPAALRELVEAEAIHRATVWETPELQRLGVADSLRALGVAVVPGTAAPQQLAECELGVTGVDAALPETGTLLLCSAADKPRVVSLLPRVHLALLRPSVMRADLPQAFAAIQAEGYAVAITGPSRTSDIELTVTIGVHGPRTLQIWVIGP